MVCLHYCSAQSAGMCCKIVNSYQTIIQMLGCIVDGRGQRCYIL
nr:MAG TPA: hypothetical protein [Caudoviricetes sp.]